MEPNKDYDNSLNNLESENTESASATNAAGEKKSTDRLPEDLARSEPAKDDGDDFAYSSPDKYLALEQPGTSFTPDADPFAKNPDNLEYRQHGQDSDVWDDNNRNTRNSEAFNQDEYVLRDNIDLDEDQSTSISSDDDFDADTNTSDGL
jgi:hypothetical protein